MKGLYKFVDNKWFYFLALFIALHLFLLSKLNFFPYPELFVYSYLTKQGLFPYKQIFDQHFPGLMFFPINLATMGIDTPDEARILHLGIVAITHILLFVTAKKLFKSSSKALITNILYLVWQPFFEGYVLWIDTFIPIFLLPAYYFLISSDKKFSLTFSAFFLGLSILFKQVTFPLVGFVFLYSVYFNKRRLNVIRMFFLGLILPLAALIVYLLVFGIWKDFVFWTVTFNLTTFAEMGRKFPDLGGLVRAFPFFGLVFALFIIGAIKKKSKELRFMLIFFIGSLAFVFARFDFVHLQPALVFGILIVTYFFIRLPDKPKFPVFLGYFLISLYLLIPFYKANFSNRVLFFGDFENNLKEKVLSYTKPKDSIFAMGTTPHIYQLTNTLPPGRVFAFQFPWFMVIGEKAIFNGIISDPPKVVIRDKNANVQGMVLVDFMPDINNYVDRYYKVVDDVDGVEIMIPN